jgi:formiminotetrahydrofolate cyclodeaminase
MSMELQRQTIQEFLDGVAAKTPTPGGGAVASVTAALAAALGRMVLNYSVDKKSLASHQQSNREALRALTDLGAAALQMAEADANAYGRLNELWKLDENDAHRVAEFPAAVNAAIQAPRDVLHASLTMLRLLRMLPDTTNAMLKSDLAIAAVLAEAAARSAAWNVRINLPLLDNAESADALNREIHESLSEAHSLSSAIEIACQS